MEVSRMSETWVDCYTIEPSFGVPSLTQRQTPTYPTLCDSMTGEPNTAAPALDDATRSFVRRALAAGLVEIDDLKKVVVSLMSESEHFTPKRLAEGLVGASILTSWQANKLLAGKNSGFYLGSYRLLRPLGKGGMGVVYLGEHHVMKRLMALKILPPEATQDERRISRFKAEARACAQLDHPNIVRAYDFAEAGGKLYIVMEYVDGIDLHYAVQRDGLMSVSDALDSLNQATRGLAHAHERGIVHRDIKPSNLLLRTDGVVKVSDLGLARIGVGDNAEEEKRRLMGTADFISPEQAINSKTADARADIYSLGCTTYYLLTGQTPFTGTAAQRLAKHQTVPMPDVRSVRSDCPGAIADLIMRMTAKRPEDRPKSAVELLSQLQRLGPPVSETPQAKRVIAPAGDTVIDDSVYQATLDDTSLTSDGEVPTVTVDEEFDFGNLPPVDLDATASGSTLPTYTASPVSAVEKSKRAKKPSSKSDSQGSQQLLLGIGLTVAVLALVAVVGFGIHLMSKPLEKDQPRIKTIENGKNVVILTD